MQFSLAARAGTPCHGRSRGFSQVKSSAVYAAEADATGAFHTFTTPTSAGKPNEESKLRVFGRVSSRKVVVLLRCVVKAGTEIAIQCNGVDVLMGIAKGEVVEDVLHRRLVWRDLREG